jgi:hypothetical protein
MNRLAVAFKRRQLKPAGAKKQRNDMHRACGGHFNFPAQGKVCYGNSRMEPEMLRYSEEVARRFCKEIGEIMGSNPRYARLYTGDFWSK